MGKLTNLKSFPQFSVDFGDDSSSKTITESALFALDSLLYVMNLSLPIQTYPNALIAFSLHHTHPVCYRERKMLILPPNSYLFLKNILRHGVHSHFSLKFPLVFHFLIL